MARHRTFLRCLPLLLLCGLAPAESGVVGSDGDSDVSVEDLRRSLELLPQQQQDALKHDPAQLSKMVRAFLIQRLVLKEALAKKWDQEPAVAAQIKRAREIAITDSFLQSVSEPPKDYPGEADLQAAYDANKAALLVPRSFLLAQIFVAKPKDSGHAAKAKEKLNVLKSALAKPGADFATIAREKSEEPGTASRGGEIGWLAETQIQPEIRAHLPKLSLNMVSAPIELNDGWHILKVLDAREPFTPPLMQVREKLADQLRAEKARAGMQAYIAKLLLEHPLAIHEPALSQILPQAKN